MHVINLPPDVSTSDTSEQQDININVNNYIKIKTGESIGNITNIDTMYLLPINNVTISEENDTSLKVTSVSSEEELNNINTIFFIPQNA